jgi:hypothetical protein
MRGKTRQTLLAGSVLAAVAALWFFTAEADESPGARANHPDPFEAPAPDAAPPDPSAEPAWQKRWVYVSSNLYVDENMAKLEDVLKRARGAGFNGVVFSDTKTLTWWLLDEPDRWKANAARLRTLATDLGLELVVCVFPFGYGEPFLANDPNLAAAVPVVKAPLVRRGDGLVPEETASIANGSFEEYRGDRMAAFGVQDDPGAGSFVDTDVFKDGRSSLRFENVGTANKHGLGRAFQRVAVKPWQQYRIRAWMKADRLTADDVRIVAIANRKDLQYQDLMFPREARPEYVSAADDLTTGWVEQSVTFNSLENSSVIVGAGVWGGRSGRLWLDSLRIDAVPALNVLRRATSPLRIEGARGAVFEEGRDFDRIEDPALGRSRWPGTYDTRHEPPAIAVPAGSRIGEGERVFLSCYNPAIFYRGQVSCSLDDPRVFELCAEQIARTKETLSPDGWFLAYDEIRCAGWAPSQKTFRDAGALLAFNVARCSGIARAEGGGKPLYIWSDMFDPYHNARGDYFLVKSSLERSWEGLDPGIVVMDWGTPDEAQRSLAFFEKRGSPLMIAAFYDEDAGENRAWWRRAGVDAAADAAAGAPQEGAKGAGPPRIRGVMYTTWRGDYSKLDEFARLWWGGAD